MTKGIFISLYINFSVYNKLEHNNILEIINKPFLNLIYFLYGFFRLIIKRNSELMDKGDNPFLPRDSYNYVKTKDYKYISMGNLEPKFLDSFQKGVEKIYNEDEKTHRHFHVKKDRTFEYNYETVSEVFANHNRDELFVKVYRIYIYVVL